ncbi:glycine-rich protein [Williamsia sp. DF01-3]|uniref:glycine-rich protein n=1 Tax=Williamsia sp. DF01-3 TaxID=2934157 RepID=UPI001FF3FCA9|nr:glycine-rich protein [Williamsia sp. DF01-3]MCK0515697.1 glycine-rich protein [Williamsia sp. DF01-3]
MPTRVRGIIRPIAIASVSGLAISLGILGAPVATALPANCAQPVADGPVTCSYVFTGAEQTFEVPANVTQLRIEAVGGQGGNAYSKLYGGRGFPAHVVGNVAVNPESTVYVLVAGRGQEARGGSNADRALGGFNGGGASGPGSSSGCCDRGGGGGASDVRTVSSGLPGSLESRLLVAAGGGGEGSSPGGAAGEDGLQFQAAGPPIVTGNSGRAGTATAGGAGGRQGQDVFSGSPGALGQGGDAGNFLGGGGGGGLYGGGGGASANGNLQSAGGGGGSSLVPTGGTFELAAADTPAIVTITYQVGSTPPPPASNCFGSVCLPN